MPLLSWSHYCYIPESTHIDELVGNGNIEAAMTLSRNKRLIDDLFWVGPTNPPEDLYPHLQLQPTTRSDRTITFIGVDVTTHPTRNSLTMGTHNKEEDMQMHIIRYPHSDSNVPRHQIKGIFIGQVIRAKVVCNRLTTFQQTVIETLRRLNRRGHPLHIFSGPWRQFLRSHWTEYETRQLQLQQLFHNVCQQITIERAATHADH